MMCEILYKIQSLFVILIGISPLLLGTATFAEIQNKLWEDTRLSVRIDKVERVSTIPHRNDPKRDLHPKKKDNDFVVINFSVPHIRNINSFGIKEFLLFDSKGGSFYI